jgi:manganese transport protein
MEGYLNLRIQPWLRRLITRLIAIVPAFIVILLLGESATGKMLVLSQVILSLQLGFAVIPLIHLTSDKAKMGAFANALWLKIAAWLIALTIVGLNVKLIAETVISWFKTSENKVLLAGLLILILLGAIMLLYISISPILKTKHPRNERVLDKMNEQLSINKIPRYARIAITVDFSLSDNKAISNAFAQGGIEAEYLLIHIVETAGARLLNLEVNDLETNTDKENLYKYKTELSQKGYRVHTVLGFGNPKKSIPELVNKSDCDLLVMGAHGHRVLKDIIFGTTLDAVRHSVNVPVLIVK